MTPSEAVIALRVALPSHRALVNPNVKASEIEEAFRVLSEAHPPQTAGVAFARRQLAASAAAEHALAAIRRDLADTFGLDPEQL